MKKSLGLIFLFFLSLPLLALPEKIEFWFFSPQTRFSELDRLLPSSSFSFSKLFAQNNFDCLPMGDGCFNPQVGYVEKENGKKTVGEAPVVTTKGALESDLIECDPNFEFDLFCGQARKQENSKSEIEMEIWFDISTSMRAIFPEGKNCLQYQFLTSLDGKCPGHFFVKTFNTRVKESSGYESVCYYSGLNDGRELIHALKASTAKKVVVISDTDEYAGELRQFIEEGNYSTRGMGAPILGSSLLQQDLSCSL